jgi:hypothetical protein
MPIRASLHRFRFGTHSGSCTSAMLAAVVLTVAHKRMGPRYNELRRSKNRTGT